MMIIYSPLVDMMIHWRITSKRKLRGCGKLVQRHCRQTNNSGVWFEVGHNVAGEIVSLVRGEGEPKGYQGLVPIPWWELDPVSLSSITVLFAVSGFLRFYHCGLLDSVIIKASL